jgi:streptomycin 6-kinase
VERWRLEPGDPFPGATVSLTMPARRDDGEEVVLKIQFPHRESEGEAGALRAWDGGGAVLLLDEDRDRHALLLERCRPGYHLSSEDPDTATEIMISLISRLSRPDPGGFTTLADEAKRWAVGLRREWEGAGRPFEKRIVDAAVETLAALAADTVPPVLLHQDLHGDNVLRAEREPWLAIDPKPLAGDPAFAPAPVVRSHELGHGRRRVIRRLDRITGELGLDRERARGWALGQTLAWAFEGGRALPRHVETARWLLEGM